MDIEAKKKHFGLLMFGVPIESRAPINNDDASVPSTSNYQSNVGSSEICNQSMPQNYILSAGAAAGNDQSTTQNAPDSFDGNNEDGSKTQQQPKRTPRPPNAFILYRKAKQPGIIASHKHLTNAEISKKISDMWKSEPGEIILKWERLADQKKLEHMQTYPNYVYCPNKNRSKVDKRKQRRRSSNKDSPTSTNPTGPARRKSTKNSIGKTPEKTTDSPPCQTVTGFNTFNTQSPPISMPPQQHDVHSNNDSVPSSYEIIASPEIPLFTENPEEFVNSQKQLAPNTPVTPNAPLTPISPHQIQLRESEFNKIRQYGGQFLRYDPEDLQQHAYQQQQQQQQQQQHQQQQHHHQHHQHHGNNHNFPFTPVNGLTSFYNAANGFSHQVDPLCCLIPEVIQTQQQIISEAMLHHDHSSNARTALYQYLHQNGGNSVNGNPPNSVVSNPSLAEILAGFECQSYAGGSVNHHHPQYFH